MDNPKQPSSPSPLQQPPLAPPVIKSTAAAAHVSPASVSPKLRVRLADWALGRGFHCFTGEPEAQRAIIVQEARSPELYARMESLRDLFSRVVSPDAETRAPGGDAATGYRMVEAKVVLSPTVTWQDFVEMRRSRSVFLGRRIGTSYVTTLAQRIAGESPVLKLAALAGVELDDAELRIDLGQGERRVFPRAHELANAVHQFGEELAAIGLDPANIIPGPEVKLPYLDESGLHEEHLPPLPQPKPSTKGKDPRQTTPEEEANREANEIAAMLQDQGFEGGAACEGLQKTESPSMAAPATAAAKAPAPKEASAAVKAPVPARAPATGIFAWVDLGGAAVKAPVPARAPATADAKATPPAPTTASAVARTPASATAHAPASASLNIPPLQIDHIPLAPDEPHQITKVGPSPLIYVDGLLRIVDESTHAALSQFAAETKEKIIITDFHENSSSWAIEIKQLLIGRQKVGWPEVLAHAAASAGIPQGEQPSSAGPARLTEEVARTAPEASVAQAREKLQVDSPAAEPAKAAGSEPLAPTQPASGTQARVEPMPASEVDRASVPAKPTVDAPAKQEKNGPVPADSVAAPEAEEQESREPNQAVSENSDGVNLPDDRRLKKNDLDVGQEIA